MAVNYASKYSSLVDERFKEAGFTAAAVNNDYNFDGVNTINIYDVDVSPMNNYVASGTNRYGSPNELGNGTQTKVLGQDRSFTYTIDKKNEQDTMGVMEAGASLRRQVDEVVIPERDCYNIATMIGNTGYLDGTAITKDNAYEKFLDARRNIRNNKAPVNGLIAFVSTNFYKLIKLDPAFVRQCDIAQNMLITGQIGRIDNIAIVEVPEYYLGGAEFIIVHPVATTSAEKLVEYRTLDNVAGISGVVVEGRLRYDAFVRKNKKGAIAVQMKGFNIQSKEGESATETIITADVDLDALKRSGLKLVYASSEDQAAATVGADLSDWTEITYTSTYQANGKTFGEGVKLTGLTDEEKVAIAFVDSANKCISPSNSVTLEVKG